MVIIFTIRRMKSNEDTTIYAARFFRIEGDEISEDEDACVLKHVPERYFSEIVMQLHNAVEAE